MNNMKQWQQDISNVVDKNSLDIKNLQDNSEIGKLTVRIDNIEAKDREQDVQLSNHGEQLENLFNKINTDVADTKTEINNTIEQLRLNTNNSITALQTSTDRALDTIKQNTTDSLNSLKTSIDRNIELLKSNTADSITALQTSIDRHTEELDNCVRSVNGVNADENGNVQLGNIGTITGKIEWFAFNTPPDGYLVCNGANVSRETYADLFAVIGTTFGSGDGSTTFNIPDLRDRYIIGANTNALGTQIAEQLPNITGYVTAQATGGSLIAVLANDPQHGALYCSNFGQENITHHSVTGQANTLNFNASRSNSIYTDNGHVYPLSLALLPCIKY